MSDIAIRVENIGKRYRIGAIKLRYKRLTETVMETLTAPVNSLKSLRRPSPNEFVWALRGVSFEVRRGETIGVIGCNGAGKSTLLKILSRIVEPTEGRAELHGRVGSLLEVGTGFHPELTGRENIYLNGAILGMKKTEIDKKFDEIVEFSGVEAFLDTPVKRYSSGMSVRLAFSVAAHLEPEILLVDEVLAVGDAAFQKKCLGKMGEVAEGGRTVLFVSHQMDAVRHLCKRAILLQDGGVALDGPSNDVITSYLSSVEYQVSQIQFPVMNPAYGIGFDYCHAQLNANSDGSSDMEIRVGIIAQQPQKRVGIGLDLTAASGTKVATLGPVLTGYTFDVSEGIHHFVIESKGIGRLLAEGDYFVGLWLSIPSAAKLVKLDAVAVIAMPGAQLYDTGRSAKADTHGPLLLPLSIRRCGEASESS